MDNSPLSSPTTPTNEKRSFRKRRLQYQDRIVEQPPLSFPTTTLMSTYLTAESIPKVSPNIVPIRFGDKPVKQEMELKAVGKLGLTKRKQFLLKRDISRSHEKGNAEDMEEKEQQYYMTRDF